MTFDEGLPPDSENVEPSTSGSVIDLFTPLVRRILAPPEGGVQVCEKCGTANETLNAIKLARVRLAKNSIDFNQLVTERASEIKRMKRGIALMSFDSDLELVAKNAALTARVQQLEALLVKGTGRTTQSSERAAPLPLAATIQMARLVFGGMTKTDVMKQLNITHSQTNVEWLAPPQWRIRVPLDGPIDWWQIWEMELTISGHRGWKSRAMARLGLAADFAYTDDPNRASAEAIESMRQDYFCRDYYTIFAQLAKHVFNKPSQKGDWREIFGEMRKRGHVVKDKQGPVFSARFNAENFELFAITEKEVSDYADLMCD